MAMTQAGGYADYDLENQQLERRRKMAEMLSMNAQKPYAAGSMVGNVYVPTHWTQHAAQALSGYASDKEMERLDARQMDVARRKQDDMRSEGARFAELLRGKPATEQTHTADDQLAYGGTDADSVSTQVQTPAVPGDRNAAMAFALGAKNPMLQQAGMAEMLKQNTPKWEKVERPNADGSKVVGYVDINSPNPWSTFQAGGTAPVKNEYVNGQAVNPFTNAATGTPIPKQLAPDSVVTMGPNGQLAPNKPVIDAKALIAKAGAPGIRVDVNTATKPMLTELGKGVGETVVNDFNNAKAAVQTLQNASQIESGLSKVIAGPTANARIKLVQIGEVLGVNGKDATEMLQNTRNAIQGLARQELAAAGQMKGQGQITESERGILRRAEAGDISELTVPEIRTLLGAIRKTANYRISQHNQNLKRLESDPNAAGVVDFMRVNTPQATPQTNAPQLPAGFRPL